MLLLQRAFREVGIILHKLLTHKMEVVSTVAHCGGHSVPGQPSQSSKKIKKERSESKRADEEKMLSSLIVGISIFSRKWYLLIFELLRFLVYSLFFAINQPAAATNEPS